jgi:cell division protein FtsL
MSEINNRKSRLQLLLLAAAALGSSSAVMSGAITVLQMQQPAHVSTLV